jgi:hypothetical protein
MLMGPTTVEFRRRIGEKAWFGIPDTAAAA